MKLTVGKTLQSTISMKINKYFNKGRACALVQHKPMFLFVETFNAKLFAMRHTRQLTFRWQNIEIINILILGQKRKGKPYSLHTDIQILQYKAYMSDGVLQSLAK